MSKCFVLLVSILSIVLSPTLLWAIIWGNQILGQTTEWYGSAEAGAAADRVLVYQSEYGAWPKNVDLLAPITPGELEKLNEGGKANTIDNGATTLPMRFLALVHQASSNEKYSIPTVDSLSSSLCAVIITTHGSPIMTTLWEESCRGMSVSPRFGDDPLR